MEPPQERRRKITPKTATKTLIRTAMPQPWDKRTRKKITPLPAGRQVARQRGLYHAVTKRANRASGPLAKAAPDRASQSRIFKDHLECGALSPLSFAAERLFVFLQPLAGLFNPSKWDTSSRLPGFAAALHRGGENPYPAADGSAKRKNPRKTGGYAPSGVAFPPGERCSPVPLRSASGRWGSVLFRGWDKRPHHAPPCCPPPVPGGTVWGPLPRPRSSAVGQQCTRHAPPCRLKSAWLAPRASFPGGTILGPASRPCLAAVGHPRTHHAPS